MTYLILQKKVGVPPTYTITLGGSNTDYGYAITADNNVYIGGVTRSGLSNYAALVAKYDATGNIQWQRRLKDTSGFSSYIYDIDTDESDNIYAYGTTSTSNSNLDMWGMLAKYNSSGVLQWQRLYKESGGITDAKANAVEKTTGNTYIAGEVLGGGYIAKISTNGTLIWSRRIYGEGTTRAYGLACDSSMNVYVVGSGVIGGVLYGFIAKYNSSGVLQWQRMVHDSSATVIYNVYTDSLNNPVIIGTASDGTGGLNGLGTVILKYNSSGVLQWQKHIDYNTNEYMYGYGISLSNTDDVICMISYTEVLQSINAWLVVKLDADGNLTWQRTLGNTPLGSGGSSQYGYGIYVDPAGSVHGIGGSDYLSSSINILYEKLNGDGLGTGTISGLEYAASTFTIENGTLIDIAGTFTDASYTLPSYTGTLIEEASTLTNTKS